VHAYVGDEVIVTWPLGRDLARSADPLVCVFAVQARINKLAPIYVQEFGVAPRFRAGIHAGLVMVSECGDTKRQIAYFGDTMNVAARLCEYGKLIDETLVVSAEMLRRTRIPAELSVGHGTSVMLRGRQAAVEVHAVSPRIDADPLLPN
jgi:class 3 adenylate cyclase